MYFIMKNFNPILLYIISSENVLGGAATVPIPETNSFLSRKLKCYSSLYCSVFSLDLKTKVRGSSQKDYNFAAWPVKMVSNKSKVSPFHDSVTRLPSREHDYMLGHCRSTLGVLLI